MKERPSYYLGKPEDLQTPVDPAPYTTESREVDIRLLAYDLWIEAGALPGDGKAYWYEAEQKWEEEWKRRTV
jgi:hypothetical protein